MNQTIVRPVPARCRRQVRFPNPAGRARRARRLLIQRCTHCGKLRHYPRLLCGSCHSTVVEWIEASGRGAIHSWTVAQHA